MKSMTDLGEGELCLPQRPHNQVGAARRRRLVELRVVADGHVQSEKCVMGS